MSSVLDKANKKKLLDMEFTIYSVNNGCQGGFSADYGLWPWWDKICEARTASQPLGIGKFVDLIWGRPSKIMDQPSYITIDIREINWTRDIIDVIIRYMGIQHYSLFSE